MEIARDLLHSLVYSLVYGARYRKLQYVTNQAANDLQNNAASSLAEANKSRRRIRHSFPADLTEFEAWTSSQRTVSTYQVLQLRCLNCPKWSEMFSKSLFARMADQQAWSSTGLVARQKTNKLSST